MCLHEVHCKSMNTEIEHYKSCNGAGSSGLQQKARLVPAESIEAVRGRAMWELGKLVRPGSGAESGDKPPTMLSKTVIPHIADTMSPVLFKDPEVHGRQGPSI